MDFPSMRIGIGYDIHKLVEGRPLILGGVTIPFEKGLLGHSDGDCLLHAIADAILGAAALGDIGKHFPDTDARFKGADSAKLLAQVVGLLSEKGYRMSNVDANIIAQVPKLAPYINDMRNKVASILGLGIDRVSVKARTNEGLEAVGRGEAIVAQVCVMLVKSASPREE